MDTVEAVRNYSVVGGGLWICTHYEFVCVRQAYCLIYNNMYPSVHCDSLEIIPGEDESARIRGDEWETFEPSPFAKHKPYTGPTWSFPQCTCVSNVSVHMGSMNEKCKNHRERLWDRRAASSSWTVFPNKTSSRQAKNIPTGVGDSA